MEHRASITTVTIASVRPGLLPRRCCAPPRPSRRRDTARQAVIAGRGEPRYGLRVNIEREGDFMTVYAHDGRSLVETGEAGMAGPATAGAQDHDE